MISLKKKLVNHCIDLILISLKNTKYWLEHIIKKKMKHFVYIITDLGNILVIENEISSLMITWLCILKNM